MAEISSISVSASISITSPPSATRAAVRRPIRCAARSWRIVAGADGITAASARRPPPYPRRRHRAAQGRDRQTAEFRNGGDRRDGRASRSRPLPHAVLPRCRRNASERTTEGGLDVAGQHAELEAGGSHALKQAGIRVSLFIAARAATRSKRRSRSRADMIEIHTGAWCDALAESQDRAGRGRMEAALSPARRWRSSAWSRSPCRPRP